MFQLQQMHTPSRFLPHHINSLSQQKSHHLSVQANEVTVENRSARGKRPLTEREKVSSTEAAAYRMGHNPTLILSLLYPPRSRNVFALNDGMPTG